MKTARITKELKEYAQEIGCKIVRVKDFDSKSMVGIHLLMPSQRELEDALTTAERDLYPAIYIHNFSTWAAGAMKRRA